jgi:hypothetical protein
VFKGVFPPFYERYLGVGYELAVEIQYIGVPPLSVAFLGGEPGEEDRIYAGYDRARHGLAGSYRRGGHDDELA